MHKIHWISIESRKDAKPAKNYPLHAGGLSDGRERERSICRRSTTPILHHPISLGVCYG